MTSRVEARLKACRPPDLLLGNIQSMLASLPFFLTNSKSAAALTEMRIKLTCNASLGAHVTFIVVLKKKQKTSPNATPSSSVERCSWTSTPGREACTRTASAPTRSESNTKHARHASSKRTTMAYDWQTAPPPQRYLAEEGD